MNHRWTWRQPVFPGGYRKPLAYGLWFPYLRVDHVQTGDSAADHAAELDSSRRIYAQNLAEAAAEKHANHRLIYSRTLIAVRAPKEPT